MGTVKEIEQAVQRLSPTDFDAFREWFVEIDAAAWERQMDNDIVAGRLDSLAAEALSDFQAGRCTDL